VCICVYLWQNFFFTDRRKGIKMDLSGIWSFQLDPEDKGIDEQWYNRQLAGTISLPGSLQVQGFGEEVSLDTQWTGQIVDRSYYSEERYAPYRQPGNIKVPFWLQPAKVYTGAAWYQREIDIPADWEGQHVRLVLERPHWETRLWVDGQPAGKNDSLSAPHVYDLGTSSRTGGLAQGRHTISLRVDNRLVVSVGINANSVTDHAQTNWNGIVGQIELSAGSPVCIEDVQVYPDVNEKTARVQLRLNNLLETHCLAGQIVLQARSYNSPTIHQPASFEQNVHLHPGATTLQVIYPLGADALTWDEFNPALYRLEVTLTAGMPDTGQENPKTALVDRKTVSFGLRQVGTQGTQITLNGRKIFLRGTLESCIFPLTGYPATDPESWRRIIQTCRRYGLNHLRFHSWCPPEAAFQAADEEGFYFQVECASWANSGATIGNGEWLDEWLYQEGHRITTAYGNHPSFLLMAYGNEPAGKIEEYLTRWVEYWKATDSRRLYTSGAGWPMLPVNQYHNVPQPRIQAWGAGLTSRINALPPETLTDYTNFVKQVNKPVISHEIGQWCVYPNFDEIQKYTGFLKAKNFEIFQDSLNASGMGDQWHDFLIASGKLQVLCYKEDIESALRTPGFAGFQLLDLHDYPGQGSALIGVVDAFWEDKGYVTGAEYSRFCNTTVPLARLEKRYWLNNETFHADIDVAHFGAEPLEKVTPRWSLQRAGGQPESNEDGAHGSLPVQDVPVGNGIRLGSIDVPLQDLKPASKYVLTVSIPGAANPNGQPVENSWDIWVFPADLDGQAPAGVTVSAALDEKTLDRLEKGGKVLLLLPPEKVVTGSQIGFSSIFWNTAWTQNQPPHTLGILCDPRHPLFAFFPTEGHSNWQWWDLVHGSAAMQIDRLPKDLRPLVQPIDTWFENRRLGLLIEARLNGGKIMICSMDLAGSLDKRPVARQMLYSLMKYMQSDQFNPQVDVTPQLIQSLTR
jgi:hypothetical protein